jgi:hypothetical protein
VKIVQNIINRMNKGRASASRSKSKTARTLAIAAGAAVAGLAASQSFAAPISSAALQNLNSMLTVSWGAATPPSGVNNWTVGSTDVLNREWFWGEVGSGAPTALNNLNETATTVANISTDDSHNNYAALTFVDPSNPLQIQTTFDLTGGSTSSNQSDLAETILITNTSSSQTLNYNFFVYSDFNMGAVTGGETDAIYGGNAAKVTNSKTGFVSNTVVSPQPSYYETSTAPTLLNQLDGGSSVQLNDNATTTTSGTTDAEWGFEWKLSLSPGACYAISIDKQVSATSVPEPCTGLAMIGVSSVLLGRRRRSPRKNRA